MTELSFDRRFANTIAQSFFATMAQLAMQDDS